jgi:hypothetical protein
LVLYKHFDELRNDFEGNLLTAESLKAFLETNGYPTVLPFDDKAI